MTDKKYEEEIASSELEKLGISKPKPKFVYPDTGYSSTGSDADYFVEDDIDSIFAEKEADNQDTLFPEIPAFLDKRKRKTKVEHVQPVVDRQQVLYSVDEYNHLSDNIHRAMCDLLEEHQLIFSSGNASTRLKKILKAYIKTQCVYKEEDEYKKIVVE